ncbi:delta-endotoxin CytB [Lentinula edodes]|nr:delta-endotoxin CytB [Lentinula edodes]
MASEANNERQTSTQGAVGDATSAFQSLAKISSDLFTTEIQLTKFAAHYLRLGNGTQWFDWQSFLRAVRAYQRDDLVLIYPNGNALVGEEGGKELIRGSSDQPTLGQTHGPIIRPDELSAVSNIADYIVYFVTQIVGVSIDADAIYATVLNAFTNLEWASESGFADFSSLSTGTNSSWEYRITFSAPYSGSSNTVTFLSFVSTILLEADIKNRSSWWGLVSSSRQHFRCEIIGLKFKVTKGFRDPVNPFDGFSDISI